MLTALWPLRRHYGWPSGWSPADKVGRDFASIHAPVADAAMLRWLNSRRQTRRTGYPAPGWSVAEDRRRAKKRRNQLRNRRAHRGGGR